MIVVGNSDALAQASDFRIEGDKLSSSAKCRIGTRFSGIESLSAQWQTKWAIKDQAINWYSISNPYYQRAFRPLAPLPVGFRTWLWRYTCLLLLIPMLWHRQAIFWRDTNCLPLLNTGFKPGSLDPKLWMPTDKPTELSMIKLKTELNNLSLWSVSIQPTWPHRQFVSAPSSGYVHVCCFWFRISGTEKQFSNRKETNCLPRLNARFKPGTLEPNLPRTECPLTNRLSYQGSS